MITVRELIEVLLTMPEDAVVMVGDSENSPSEMEGIPTPIDLVQKSYKWPNSERVMAYMDVWEAYRDSNEPKRPGILIQ